MAATTPAVTTLALKEWGAVVCALLDGRQTVLLRKGGIHEKAFRVHPLERPDVTGAGHGRAEFVVFPTVAHSHAERVRPEHHDVLACGREQVDEARNTFWVRAGVTVVDAVEVRRPEGLVELEDLHIWTRESVRHDRLEFRPRHHLWALVVRAVALPAPVRLDRVEEYAGCRSWVDLPVAWDGVSGAAIHPLPRLRDDAARVRAAVA